MNLAMKRAVKKEQERLDEREEPTKDLAKIDLNALRERDPTDGQAIHILVQMPK